ncbi:hypothetical protein GCM10009735_82610 [Actinomadura chokoriensis]
MEVQGVPVVTDDRQDGNYGRFGEAATCPIRQGRYAGWGAGTFRIRIVVGRDAACESVRALTRKPDSHVSSVSPERLP